MILLVIYNAGFGQCVKRGKNCADIAVPAAQAFFFLFVFVHVIFNLGHVHLVTCNTAAPYQDDASRECSESNVGNTLSPSDNTHITRTYPDPLNSRITTFAEE